MPSGAVIAYMLDAPGSWHDSFIAEYVLLYKKLQAIYKSTGGITVLDSSFSEVMFFSF